MTLILDSGPLYAHLDRNDPDFGKVVEILDAEPGSLVVPAFVVAEVDYMVLRDMGVDAEVAFLDDLASGAFQMEALNRGELREARDIVRRYRDLEVGVADASVVVLARRLSTTRLLTFDERHFRAMEPLQGGHFTILPADA